MNALSVILCILCAVLAVAVIFVYKLYKDESSSKSDPESEYNRKVQQLNSDYDIRKQNIEETLSNLQYKLNQDQSEKVEELKNLYSDKKLALNEEFKAESDRILNEIAEIRSTLEYYEDLQKAVIENFKEQDRIRLERDFYRISLTDLEQSDIVKLRTVALEISKPVVLYKLIYEIYYKSKFDELFKRLIGSDDSGGIYKITNTLNERVYIGRTTNFLSRWRDHVKCGTGSDSGAQVRTRLYEAMRKDGCENFTFEILDRCDKDSQPEREKYWIDFYKSTEFGYNIQSGG